GTTYGRPVVNRRGVGAKNFLFDGQGLLVHRKCVAFAATVEQKVGVRVENIYLHASQPRLQRGKLRRVRDRAFGHLQSIRGTARLSETAHELHLGLRELSTVNGNGRVFVHQRLERALGFFEKSRTLIETLLEA